jgi:multimeric flavodoxin WrbA
MITRKQISGAETKDISYARHNITELTTCFCNRCSGKKGVKKREMSKYNKLHVLDILVFPPSL